MARTTAIDSLKPLSVGERYRIPYPFCWGRYYAYDDVGHGTETDTWRPGIHFCEAEYYDAEPVAAADGMGHMLLEVISIHKPGKYPERVFFIRTWENPDGKMFGKKGLRITTSVAFRQLLQGYRHEYELEEN